MKDASAIKLWLYKKDGKYSLHGFYSNDERSLVGVCMTPRDDPFTAYVAEDECRRNTLKTFDFKIAEALQNVEIAKEAKQRFLAISAE